MISKQQADNFSHEWIEAWNAHDLDRILSHYADTVEFTSPLIVERLGDPSGTIRGKAKLRAYFEAGLRAFPELRFEPLHTLIGVRSVTLHYRSIRRRLSAEVMELDESGKVVRGIAHYTDEAPGDR